jgi:hypothetical protein
MHRYEYCNVKVALYREGGDPGPAQELLTLQLPDVAPASVTAPFGVTGLLNKLGSEGWELVDVESGTYWLMRKADKHDKHRHDKHRKHGHE